MFDKKTWGFIFSFLASLIFAFPAGARITAAQRFLQIKSLSSGLAPIVESFEDAGACPSTWTAVGYTPHCSTSSSYKNLGSYSLFLRAWIDYGSGNGAYKAFDLTGRTKIEVDVVGLDSATNKACLQIFSSAPSAPANVIEACNNGVLSVQRSTVGKLTLNLSGQTGIYYVYLQAWDTYDVQGAYFDSLTIY